MKQLNHILIIAMHKTSLNEFLLVAKAMLEGDSELIPLVVVRNEALAEEAIRQLPEENVIHFHEYAQQLRMAYRPLKLRVIWRLLSLLPHIVWQALAIEEILHYFERFQNNSAAAQQIFERYSPVAILTMGDRHLSPEAEFIHIASKRGCPVVVLPTAFSDPDSNARNRIGNDSLYLHRVPHRWLKRWIALRYPRQVRDTPLGKMLFYAPTKILAMAILGILPRNPWIIGGNGADMLCVIGEQEKEKFISYGVVPERITITGLPSYDTIYTNHQDQDNIRTHLYEKYQLANSKKLVICAVPQLAEHGLLPWEKHWEEIRFLAEVFASTPANVLLSLHPRSSREDYQFIENEYGLRILDEPLAQAVCAADLLVSASTSTTILTSVFLHIPSLAINFYDLHNDQYNRLEGVVKIDDKDIFAETLRDVIEDEERYRKLQAAQYHAAEQITPFDGNAIKRIIKTLEARVIPL